MKREWDCPAKSCPDRTGKLEEICKRCPTYTEKYIDCSMTYCEAFPEECNKDSIHCKRCANYDVCYSYLYRVNVGGGVVGTR